MSEQFYISFGSGIKLLSEDWYIKEFGSNITKKSFRSFCRALKVPLIEVGKTTFVEMNSFQLALKAITRVGEPDFFVSGCKSVAVGRQRPSQLDPDYVTKNLEPLLCELLACKAISGLSLTKETKKAIHEAAERMARAGLSLLPEEMQKKYTRKSIRIFGDTTARSGSILNIYDEEKPNEEPDTGDDSENNV
jgi:hypothetical protein